MGSEQAIGEEQGTREFSGECNKKIAQQLPERLHFIICVQITQKFSGRHLRHKVAGTASRKGDIMVAGDPRQALRVMQTPFQQQKKRLKRKLAAIDDISEEHDPAVWTVLHRSCQERVKREEISVQIPDKKPLLRIAALFDAQPGYARLMAEFQERRRSIRLPIDERNQLVQEAPKRKTNACKIDVC